MTPITGAAALGYNKGGGYYEVLVDGHYVFTSRYHEKAELYAEAWNHALYYVNKKSGSYSTRETLHRLGEHERDYDTLCLLCNPGKGKGYTL